MRARKMILQKKDFITSKIDWSSKSINIQKILRNLRLRANDAIFIDDNLLEIEKVKKIFQTLMYFILTSQIIFLIKFKMTTDSLKTKS